ncbi:MAG: uroporphyrinogen decarboxylase family protein [Peptoniphilus sp.]|nr:uroporphyrinogen decarboxylase family protein [Peptoniphilus sp.]MDD7362856.1 uroporphyrinogen decarboxylase family protein [Bacillota bacterium]MDY6043952.1 uroporphyrinogen decarboxylase family protein [Peptoniphilus sp.]
MANERNRLLNVLRGEEADRAPCICPGGMMNMVTRDLMELSNVYLPEAHVDARKMADLAKAVYDKGCFENYGVPFCMTVEAQDMGAGVDMGSTVFEPRVNEYPIESVSDYKTLKPLDIDAGRGKVVLDAIRILKEETEGVPVIGNITGPVSTASSLMEPVHYYKELRRKNKESHEYMAFITEQLIQFALAEIDAGADIITISDPSGTGEILGPKLFEEFTVTYINQLLDAIEPTSVPVIVHICGRMTNVFEEVNHIHSHALSFDSIVSVSNAKKNLPGRLIMGNVSTYSLEYGDPQKVSSLTEACLHAGSDIISPACGIGMRSPIENIRAMHDCVTGQERNR